MTGEMLAFSKEKVEELISEFSKITDAFKEGSTECVIGYHLLFDNNDILSRAHIEQCFTSTSIICEQTIIRIINKVNRLIIGWSLIIFISFLSRTIVLKIVYRNNVSRTWLIGLFRNWLA